MVTLTADIVAAHVGNNKVAIADVPLVITAVHTALNGLQAKAEPPAEDSRREAAPSKWKRGTSRRTI
ncbi:MucR family transcriptional regulator [Sphingopyxis sp. KK2]|uniref:MucR family transcriptional regulator n=1 Tax=Sphingopyxis sp. KK2 TaxID=1855727 RepID=UPI00097E7032|nr:MucR family transcriptional regulator [Sphingopyxis sp. KK2]